MSGRLTNCPRRMRATLCGITVIDLQGLNVLWSAATWPEFTHLRATADSP